MDSQNEIKCIEMQRENEREAELNDPYFQEWAQSHILEEERDR